MDDSVRFPKIKHKEWLEDAMYAVMKSIQLQRKGVVPEHIEGWMLTVPIRRLLRCIFGSDKEAAEAMIAWNAEDQELYEAYKDVGEIQ